MGEVPTYIRPVNIFSTQVLSRRTTPYIGTIFGWGVSDLEPTSPDPISLLSSIRWRSYMQSRKVRSFSSGMPRIRPPSALG